MGLRIKEARKATGLNQERFAALLHVSRSAVANWEADRNPPDLVNLVEVAKRSGYYLEWLGVGRGPKRYGDPALAEEPPPYIVADAVDRQILDRLTRMPRSRKRALLEFIDKLELVEG